MKNQITHALALAVLAALLAGSVAAAQDAAPAPASPQDQLAEVKSLYASAAYEEALNALERVDAAAQKSVTALEYRALCMFGLGRTKDAEVALATLIEKDPSYQPDSSSASPRVLAAFHEVRARTLPAVIQKEYAAGKSAFEEQRYDDSSAAFNRMLGLLNDPDLGEQEQARLSDLRTVAAGFRDLIRATRRDDPAKRDDSKSPGSRSAEAEPQPAASGPSSAPASEIVPAVKKFSPVPPWPAEIRLLTPRHGIVEANISADGKVDSVKLVQGVHPLYDRRLLQAIKGWTFEPARRGGRPIQSVKIIDVTVGPPQ